MCNCATIFEPITLVRARVLWGNGPIIILEPGATTYARLRLLLHNRTQSDPHWLYHDCDDDITADCRHCEGPPMIVMAAPFSLLRNKFAFTRSPGPAGWNLIHSSWRVDRLNAIIERGPGWIQIRLTRLIRSWELPGPPPARIRARRSYYILQG